MGLEWYLQKVVQHPGYDLGVCFMGEEYIGTYARVGNKDQIKIRNLIPGHENTRHSTFLIRRFVAVPFRRGRFSPRQSGR